jgi:hypothetical protein
MEVHKVFDADTGALVGTYKSLDEVQRLEQEIKQKNASNLVLKRQDDQYDDDYDVYFLYRYDIKDENHTELKQPPALAVPKPSTIKPSEHITEQQLIALEKYYNDILAVGAKRLEECKRLKELCLLKRDAIKTLLKNYLKNVLKDYEKKWNQVKDSVEQTNTFCDTFLKGGVQNVVQALKTTKYSQDDRYATLMDFLEARDSEYSEDGLNENYKTVQHVLTTSKTTVEMQQPALRFCQQRVTDYVNQIEQYQDLAQQWRDLLSRAKDLVETQELLVGDFDKSKKVLLTHLRSKDRDSQLLIMSAQNELEQRQIEKKLEDVDEELREVLWKCIELSCKENGRIKMEPMMKLHQRMAQFLAMLDGVHQTVQKTLIRGALARIKFAYHLPSIYPTCIAEVLRRKDFKKIMRIELDNLLEVLESAFRGENGERAKYDKQIKLKIGDDDVHREILDSLVPGLLEKIRESEIMTEYRQLKERTLSFDSNLPQQVDTSNKEEAEFVFVEGGFYEGKPNQKDAQSEPKRDVQAMAQNMSATMYFEEVSKQAKEVKQMVAVVNQHEKQRQQELQQQKQQRLQQLQKRAEQVDDESDSDGETEPQQAHSVKENTEELERLRQQLTLEAEERQRAAEAGKQKELELTENTKILGDKLNEVSKHIAERDCALKKAEEERIELLARLEESKVVHHATHQEFERRNQMVESKIEDLKRKNQDLSVMLENKQGAAKEMLEQLQAQTVQYKSQILRLEEELSVAHKELRLGDEKSRKLQQDSEYLKKEMSSLAIELERTRKQTSALDNDINERLRERKKMEEKVKLLERENQILLEEKEAFQDKLVSQTQHTQRSAMEIENLKQALDRTTDTRKKQEEETSKLTQNLRELEKHVAESNVFAKKLRQESDDKLLRQQTVFAEDKDKMLLEFEIEKKKLIQDYENRLAQARTQKAVQQSGSHSELVEAYEKSISESDAKIKQLSELVSNSTKVIASLNNKAAVWDKSLEALKKQFTYTMTHRMAALTEASRKLSEMQAKVNQSGTTYEKQQKIFRLNLVQQSKIVRETISEYVEVFAALGVVSPLIGDLVDYTKQSLGDMDQIMTQCEIMCRDELESGDEQNKRQPSGGDKRTVVLRNFSVDDRIVFFRSQRNQELWEAFNDGNPNYFLSPEAVLSLKHKMGQHYAQTHVSIGVAVEIEKCNCPENNSNPLKLSGPYHIVTAVLE